MKTSPKLLNLQNRTCFFNCINAVLSEILKSLLKQGTVHLFHNVSFFLVTGGSYVLFNNNFQNVPTTFPSLGVNIRNCFAQIGFASLTF